jgi:hypothetical protein
MKSVPVFAESPGKEFPRLLFEYGFDEREAYEANARGFRGHVTVEFETGERFPLSFYDPVALQQEVQNGMKWGYVCVAEPGMVVLPEITIANMCAAVARLVTEGYFNYFRPLDNDAANKALNPTGNKPAS